MDFLQFLKDKEVTDKMDFYQEEGECIICGETLTLDTISGMFYCPWDLKLTSIEVKEEKRGRIKYGN